MYRTIYLSIRLSLDDIVKDSDYEKKVLENIRYCRRIVGKEFKVIFWNKDLSDKKVKDFVKRNENILFEINTKITKKFDLAWFVVGDADKSKHRYMYNGDILEGIANYLKLVKVLLKRRKDEDSNRR